MEWCCGGEGDDREDDTREHFGGDLLGSGTPGQVRLNVKEEKTNKSSFGFPKEH